VNPFRKIREKLRQNAAINEIMDDLKNLDEVLLEKRLEIFKKKVTPEFAKIGLDNWNGKYLWFSEFNQDGIKHVIEYNVFKHYGGSFSYGNCFSSVPTLSGNKLVNHRTDKSTKIHLFRRLSEWQKSMETNSRSNPDKISTINEEKFNQTLNSVLIRNIPELKVWFENHQNLEQNILTLTNDSENPPFEIGQRIVSSEYILSFLSKQKGETETSQFWLKKHLEKNLNSPEEIELLVNKVEN
jgi:hypothetical protein